jgi:hypothetical protein
VPNVYETQFNAMNHRAQVPGWRRLSAQWFANAPGTSVGLAEFIFSR